MSVQADTVCRKCNGRMKPSKAYIKGIYYSPAPGHGKGAQTMIEGPSTLPPQDCMKCINCGHSYELVTKKG